jgi:hypothetical protein
MAGRGRAREIGKAGGGERVEERERVKWGKFGSGGGRRLRGRGDERKSADMRLCQETRNFSGWCGLSEGIFGSGKENMKIKERREIHVL